MIAATKTVPVDLLEFDARNPRLIHRPKNSDRLTTIKRHLESPATVQLCNDIMEDCYVAPEPLLAIETEGRITVVDGNRRLAALIITHDQAVWDQVNASIYCRNITKPLNAVAEATVVIMDSWDEIHRLRIRKHRATRSTWSSLATAHDHRRMLLAGYTYEDIGKFYNFGKLHRSSARTAEMVCALNLLEQLNAGQPEPWDQPDQYHNLLQAVRMHYIRARLGIEDPTSYAPDQKPLDDEGLARAAVLMAQLCGTNSVQPKIRNDTERDIEYLDEIYGDPDARQRLEQYPFETVRSVRNRMRGHEDLWEVKRSLEILQGMAVRELKELKDSGPELIPNPGSIHIAHSTYCIHNDQSSQYSVNLTGSETEQHRRAGIELQKILRSQGFTECQVNVQ